MESEAQPNHGLNIVQKKKEKKTEKKKKKNKKKKAVNTKLYCENISF